MKKKIKRGNGYRSYKELCYLLKKRTERKNKVKGLANHKRKDKYEQSHNTSKKKNKRKKDKQEFIVAPKNISLLKSSEEEKEDVLHFFNQLRSTENLMMDLSKVEDIDFFALSIVKAIFDERQRKGKATEGNLPTNGACKKIIIDSGFLEGLITDTGRKIGSSQDSTMLSITNNGKSLTEKTQEKINNIGKKIYKKVLNIEKPFPPLKSIILEICGNSWEHSEVEHWIMGVSEKENYFRITVCDLGEGIFRTLYRRLLQRFSDSFKKTKVEVILDAFSGKYTSKTQETNRNKGLPMIKQNVDNNYVKNFNLLTNNVYLSYEKDYYDLNINFKGTAYMFDIDKNCILQFLQKNDINI